MQDKHLALRFPQVWIRKTHLIQRKPKRSKDQRQRLLPKGEERRSFHRLHHNMTVQQSLILLNSLLAVGPRGELLKCMFSSCMQLPKIHTACCMQNVQSLALKLVIIKQSHAKKKSIYLGDITIIQFLNCNIYYICWKQCIAVRQQWVIFFRIINDQMTWSGHELRLFHTSGNNLTVELLTKWLF